MSKRIIDPKILIGILISILFLYLAFYGLPLKQIYEELLRIQVVWLIPLIILNILSMILRSYRWRLFFSGNRPPLRDTFCATMIGYMANNVLPARIGEFVRAYVLSRRSALSASKSMATIVAERVFDVISVLLVFGLYMIYSLLLPASQRIEIPPSLRIGSTVSLAIGLAALLVMALLRAAPNIICGWVDRSLGCAHRLIAGHQPKPGSFRSQLARIVGENVRRRIHRMILSFIGGLSILGSARDILEATVWSFVNWAGLILGLVFSFKAFNFPLSFSAAVFLIFVMALGVSVPSGPGSIGTFHGISMFGLWILKIEPEAARAAYAIIVHACSYIPVTLIGLGYMIREGMSFHELRKHSAHVTGQPDPASESPVQSDPSNTECPPCDP